MRLGGERERNEKEGISVKKVLVTGAEGQLGTDLCLLLKSRGYKVLEKNKTQMDVTNPDKVEEVILNAHPDVIIHCAAYTKVDEAEKNADLAFLVNTLGTRYVATAAERLGIPIVYMSTDYVFDGESGVPYHEFSCPSPINVYGESKFAGERIVKEVHSRYFIVRTSWLFGQKGPNFVETMLKLARERASLSVVDDQRGSPTYTVDLSSSIVGLIGTSRYGTYHISNSGDCSWYGFAKELFIQRGMDVDLKPCTSEQFKRPAKRPSFSVLDHMGLRNNHFAPMPHWKDGLRRYLAQNPS
ncbi:dTDP-4-dehydrorhamnose reductase [Rossellomorea sp. YZS02]|uniref:dTDP-4-dehydrorhamnose reductase n=1 Tax=Rossellomorea sp. YZS02 TaxID=3097358 RepID=UPI002A0DF5FD|nr:dTDP-4-dehydrorhamnose reductase [Rossellomorea sp. YZS02]MDX8345779.1 dTDP-4-dehydrorhamnose reductase [Rossellomorea sp. YZS02]